jgi:hypothetical protein
MVENAVQSKSGYEIVGTNVAQDSDRTPYLIAKNWKFSWDGFC